MERNINKMQGLMCLRYAIKNNEFINITKYCFELIIDESCVKITTPKSTVVVKINITNN